MVAEIDWYRDLGGTAELLAAAQGVPLPNLHFWRRRRIVVLTDLGCGTGTPMRFKAVDALQVAVARDLATATVVGWTPAVWETVHGRMQLRQHGLADGREAIAVAPLPSGLLRTWRFDDAGPLPCEVPAAALLLRTDRLIDSVAARIRELTLIDA